MNLNMFKVYNKTKTYKNIRHNSHFFIDLTYFQTVYKISEIPF